MPNAVEPALTGGCQCGHVTYSSANLPSSLTNCYCQTCRRLSGAPFVTFGQFPYSAITWTSGPESMKKTAYSELAERTHCANCGSPISMQYKCDPDNISITIGTVNEESLKGTLPPVTQHIFVGKGSIAGWYELPNDHIPMHSKFSHGFQKRLDDWREGLTEP